MTGRVIACLAALEVAVASIVVGSSPAHAADISVTTTADSGPGSLREALAQAEASAADDHISFAQSVTGTIELTSGELDVAVGGSSGNLTVDGPGPDVLVVEAGGQSRVLDVHGLRCATAPSAAIRPPRRAEASTPWARDGHGQTVSGNTAWGEVTGMGVYIPVGLGGGIGNVGGGIGLLGSVSAW